MAGDALKRVQSGQRIKRLPADAWNAFVDTANDYRARQGGNSFDDVPAPWKACIVLVKNASGEDRDRFEVLCPDEPVITSDEEADEFQQRVFLSAIAPTDYDWGNFVVLLDAIPSGDTGRAVIWGVVVTKVYAGTQDDSDSLWTADINQGDATLTLVDGGSAEVIWRKGGTGNQWAIVRIGNLPRTRRMDIYSTTEQRWATWKSYDPDYDLEDLSLNPGLEHPVNFDTVRIESSGSFDYHDETFTPTDSNPNTSSYRSIETLKPGQVTLQFGVSEIKGVKANSFNQNPLRFHIESSTDGGTTWSEETAMSITHTIPYIELPGGGQNVGCGVAPAAMFVTSPRFSLHVTSEDIPKRFRVFAKTDGTDSQEWTAGVAYFNATYDGDQT